MEFLKSKKFNFIWLVLLITVIILNIINMIANGISLILLISIALCLAGIKPAIDNLRS